jgi:hypothetical protein
MESGRPCGRLWPLLGCCRSREEAIGRDFKRPVAKDANRALFSPIISFNGQQNIVIQSLQTI